MDCCILVIRCWILFSGVANCYRIYRCHRPGVEAKTRVASYWFRVAKRSHQHILITFETNLCWPLISFAYSNIPWKTPCSWDCSDFSRTNAPIEERSSSNFIYVKCWICNDCLRRWKDCCFTNRNRTFDMNLHSVCTDADVNMRPMVRMRMMRMAKRRRRRRRNTEKKPERKN